jgi:diguanylate cyclase (GGDEF)-like protein
VTELPATGARSSADSPFEIVALGAETVARADLEGALDRILRAMADYLGGVPSITAAVFLQDPDRPGLRHVDSIGVDEETLGALASAVLDPEHPIARTVADGRATFNVAPRAPGGPKYRSHIPMVISRDGVEVPLGALAVAHEAELDEEARRLVQAVADLAAAAVDRARLASLATERAEWFERTATSDPLTGLANARVFNRALELELARASRQQAEVSVAVFDIDDFRAINEASGREAGDLVLREVAAVLAGSVRLLDTVARRGADEFALVAPGFAGHIPAQRIVDGVAKLSAVGGRAVTVSAGIARFPADGATAEELIIAAEHALGEARQRGPGSMAEASAAVPETTSVLESAGAPESPGVQETATVPETPPS